MVDMKRTIIWLLLLTAVQTFGQERRGAINAGTAGPLAVANAPGADGQRASNITANVTGDGSRMTNLNATALATGVVPWVVIPPGLYASNNIHFFGYVDGALDNTEALQAGIDAAEYWSFTLECDQIGAANISAPLLICSNDIYPGFGIEGHNLPIVQTTPNTPCLIISNNLNVDTFRDLHLEAGETQSISDTNSIGIVFAGPPTGIFNVQGCVFDDITVQGFTQGVITEGAINYWGCSAPHGWEIGNCASNAVRMASASAAGPGNYWGRIYCNQVGYGTNGEGIGIHGGAAILMSTMEDCVIKHLEFNYASNCPDVLWTSMYNSRIESLHHEVGQTTNNNSAIITYSSCFNCSPPWQTVFSAVQFNPSSACWVFQDSTSHAATVQNGVQLDPPLGPVEFVNGCLLSNKVWLTARSYNLLQAYAFSLSSPVFVDLSSSGYAGNQYPYSYGNPTNALILLTLRGWPGTVDTNGNLSLPAVTFTGPTTVTNLIQAGGVTLRAPFLLGPNGGYYFTNEVMTNASGRVVYLDLFVTNLVNPASFGVSGSNWIVITNQYRADDNYSWELKEWPLEITCKTNAVNCHYLQEQPIYGFVANGTNAAAVAEGTQLISAGAAGGLTAGVRGAANAKGWYWYVRQSSGYTNALSVFAHLIYTANP